MQRVLVTGATGLIGGELVRQLLPDAEVWAIARELPADPDPRIRWIRHDLALGVPMIGLPRRIDAVVHMAQSRRFREFPGAALEVHNVAVDATMQLLDWAERAGADRFLLASTGGLYGKAHAPAKEEETPLPVPEGPLAFYFTSKRLAEDLALAYRERFAVTVLRYFFVYGRRQAPDMLVRRLQKAVETGTPVTLQGQDGLAFNPTHVRDAAALTKTAVLADHPGVFNIAGPETTTLRALVTELGAASGRTPVFQGDPTAEPNDLVADIGRASRVLGRPGIGVRDGIRLLYESGGGS